MTTLTHGTPSLDPNDLTEITPRRIIPPYHCSPEQAAFATIENASTQRWRRATILANAREIIAESGCHSLTMRELASRSKVTPPTIYNLVGERSEVLYQSINESFMVKVRYVDMVAKHQNVNPVLLLPDIYWMSNLIDPEYSRNVIREVTQPKTDQRISDRIIMQTEMVVLRWIGQLHEQGRLRLERSGLQKQAATLISRHMCNTIADWAEDDRDRNTLRYDLAAGVSLPLLAISSKSEAANIELWLANLEANI